MFCKNCGQENAEDLNFCQKCGTSLVQAEQTTSPAQEEQGVNPTSVVEENVNGDYKMDEMPEQKSNINIVGLLMKIGIPVVALVLVLVIGISLFSPGKYLMTTDSMLPIYNQDDEKTSIIINNKLHSKTIDSEAADLTFSMDNKIGFMLDEDDTLYAVDSKKITKIAENVEEFVSSLYGKGVAYMTFDDELYLYDVAKDKKEKVSGDAPYNFVISPNGKTVLYNTYEDEDSSETKLSLYTNGKSTNLTKDLEAVAVADSAKYIYAISDEDELYTLNTKGDKNKLSNDVRRQSFNNDYSEVLFITNDGGTYLSVKGKDKSKISSDMAYILLPSGVSSVSNSYNISSFKNQAFLALTDSDNVVSIVNSKGESESVVKKVSNVSISNDGKTIFYTKNDKLYRSDLKADAEGVELVKDISSNAKYAITPDGKGVYYIDDDEILRYTTNGKKNEKILDDVNSVVVTNKGVALFINDDDELYSTTNGKKASKISQNDEETSVIIVGNYAYYSTINDNDEMSLFVSDGSDKFKAVLTKISIY